MIDIGYFVYKIISFWFIRKINLECINISIKKLIGIKGKERKISEIIKIEINIDGYLQDIFFYVIRDHLRYNLILEKPWMNHHDVRIALKVGTLFIHSSRARVMSNKGRKWKSSKLLKLLEIGAIAYQSWLK